MVFQPKKIDLNLVFFNRYDKVDNHTKAISELFGTFFVAWVIQFQKETINRLDFLGGFFYA